MNNFRRGILGLLLLLCALCAMPAFAEPAAAAPKTVSILYFANTAGIKEYDWLCKGFADMLISDLAKSGDIVVVERENLQKILKEQELALSGIGSDSEAIKVAKLLNANALVYGSFVVSKDAIRIDARAIDVSNSAILGTSSVTGFANDVLDLERELATRISKIFNVPPPPAKDENDLSAVRSYYTGLMKFDDGDFAGAVELFRQSAQADPSYLKPQQGIEASYKFLNDFKRMRQQREMNALVEDIALLKARLAAPRFYSFADALTNPKEFGFADAKAVSEAYQARPRVWAGDRPAQALWELQHLYMELGDLAMEYFEDANLEKRCYEEILAIGKLGEERYPKDPFLPEVLYMELFAYQYFEQWEMVKKACERLMLDYPDYRMMWAIEDFYERALDHLSGKKE